MIFLQLITDEDTRNYLEKLYGQYKFLSYKIAHNIVKNPNDSEDIVQETFTKLAEFLQDRGKDSINEEKAFIGKITSNIALNHVDLGQRHPHINIESIDPISETFIEPEINILRMDKIGVYTKSLAKINKGYAYIIMLKYSEELTVPEIAKLLDISEDATRKRISRARIAYKNIIKEGESDVW